MCGVSLKAPYMLVRIFRPESFTEKSLFAETWQGDYVQGEQCFKLKWGTCKWQETAGGFSKKPVARREGLPSRRVFSSAKSMQALSLINIVLDKESESRPSDDSVCIKNCERRYCVNPYVGASNR